MVAASSLIKDLPVHLLMSGKASKDAPGAARTQQEQDIDMLIVGAYRRSPLRGLVSGSKTSDLLRSARIPALLLR